MSKSDLITADVELFLGECRTGNEQHPSADNIAVMFPPVALPAWESS
jgi:hypothetical protein